jgi:hypothetical protein
MRKLVAGFALAFFASISVLATPPAPQVEPISAEVVAVSNQNETVAFNTKSLKYHCPRCQHARRCTNNCIEIKKSEAVKRGGVACMTCGGSCK